MFTDVCPPSDPTYDSGRLSGLDERQRAVVRLLGDVDKAFFQLVLLEDAVELVEEAHPLVPLLIAVSQDQDGGLVAAGGGELGRRHLGREEGREGGLTVFLVRRDTPIVWTHQTRLTLNIQGMSLRLAWMTSEARTELTENSSSLNEERERIRVTPARC